MANHSQKPCRANFEDNPQTCPPAIQEGPPENATYLGAITLRHELNDFLLRAGGHIGYGIRPAGTCQVK
jgi:predicted acetyltransferase